MNKKIRKLFLKNHFIGIVRTIAQISICELLTNMWYLIFGLKQLCKRIFQKNAFNLIQD